MVSLRLTELTDKCTACNRQGIRPLTSFNFRAKPYTPANFLFSFNSVGRMPTNFLILPLTSFFILPLTSFFRYLSTKRIVPGTASNLPPFRRSCTIAVRRGSTWESL